jgi:hypothetical protein
MSWNYARDKRQSWSWAFANTYKVSVRKSEEKRTHARPRHGQESNVENGLQKE